MLLFTFLYFLAFRTGVLMCTPKRQCLGIMLSGSKWGRTSSPSHPGLRILPSPFILEFSGKVTWRPLPVIFHSWSLRGLGCFQHLLINEAGWVGSIYCQVGMKETTRQCWAGSQSLLEVILLRDITENGCDCSWLCGQWAQKHGSAEHTCVGMCSEKCLKDRTAHSVPSLTVCL